MIAEIELLAGKYVANVGESKPEWPPHPARLFSALVSEYYRRGFDGDREKREALEWLQRQDPPNIYFPDMVDQKEVSNYVPKNQKSSTGIKERLGNENEQKLIGVTIPEKDHVYFRWNTNEESPEYIEAIRELALGIPYLGSSESTARINIVTDSDLDIDDDCNVVEYTDSAATDYSIRVPEQNELEKLERFHGKKERPFSGTPIGYRKIYEDEEPDTGAFDEVIVLKRTSGPRPPLEHFYKISKVARKATISIADELTEGDVPAVISGHNDDGTPLEDTHIGVIPLANVGGQYADGSILGIGIILPTGMEEDGREVLGRAITGGGNPKGSTRLDRLNLGHMGEMGIKYDTEPDLKTLDKRQYTRESRKWTTVTPYVFGRYPRKKSQSEVVAESCRRIGLSHPPKKIRTMDTSPINGVPEPGDFNYDYAHFDSNKLKKHVVLEFEKPVKGPMVLGAGRYFGSGLMRPLSEGGE